MSRKKRVLRWVLIVLSVIAIAGIGAFSTFFFNPFEGGLGVDVAGLVDRDVDLFVARADLARTFDDFPRLAVQDQLEEHDAWKVWSSSPEHAQLMQSLGIEAALQQLEQATGNLPLGLEPIGLFGGRDLAVAADFRGASFAESDWAVFGTLSWLGKLGFAAVRHPGLIGLSKQGITALVEDDYVELSGGQLKRKLYVARMRDVGIVATNREYVDEALMREQLSYQDSMLLRAEYGDHIQARSGRDEDDFEVWLNLRTMFESLKISGAWPDAKSQDFLPSFLARYFQASVLNYVVGTIGVQNGIRLDVRAQLSSEAMSAHQSRTYRRPGVDQVEIRRDLARLVPADTGLMLYLRDDAGDLLEAVFASMLPETRQLVENAFQQTGRFRDLAQFIEFWDANLHDRFLVIVRPNDYTEDAEGPPHDQVVVPAIAVIGWLREGKAKDVEEFRDLIGNNARLFGLRGRNEGDGGYWKNREAGYDTREFWNPLIPGTGAIATANVQNEMVIVTNSHPMLTHLLRTKDHGAPEYPRLAERGDFEALLGTGLPTANLLAWTDPKSLAKILRAQARQQAEASVVIDWTEERAKAEQQVVRDSMPELATAHQRRQLTPEQQQQLDARVDPVLTDLRTRIYAEQVPLLMAELERTIVYLESVSAALAMIQLDPRFLELALRIVIPLER